MASANTGSGITGAARLGNLPNRQRAEALDLLRVIGNMLADGDLARVLAAAGDRGAQLRADLMLAILDVILPTPMS
ncbi:hypothetical protein ACRU3B_18180 [Mycobacterium colombiense]